jgi:predicted alpha/beta superfamily hydrolase
MYKKDEMKNLSLIIMLLTSIFANGQSIEKITIYSEILNQDRNLLVYKPSDFYYYPNKKFEVIYVFDSQNREMFDLVHSSLNFISPEHHFIVVGIQSPFIEIADNFYARNDDMLPKAKDEKTRQKYFSDGLNGNAENFRKHIEGEVFPFIENNYRTFPLRVAVGHSNSATFSSYCFLEKPKMFDAYLIQSPNFAYDNNQFVNRFSEFNFNTIKKDKFIFLTNANESKKTGWKGWKEAREKVYSLLQNIDSNKVHLVLKKYPNSTHINSYLKSSIDGLTSFIDYQFKTAKNIIRYNEFLESKKLIKLNPDNINILAYLCFNDSKPNEALQVINWAINKFPNNDNLYDSRGEFYESIGNKKKAKESYLNAIENLNKNKANMKKNKFEERLIFFKKNYNRVK